MTRQKREKISVFYYLGRKKRLARFYPSPIHDTIIEPFAGSAAYSLHENNWKKNVIINDIAPHTILAWEYLLSATRADILSLPDLKPGDKLSQYKQLSEAELWIIRWHISPGSRPNRKNDTVSRFSQWNAGKRYILNNLHKIKHWTLVKGDYSLLSNKRATWFIDPPYEATQHDYYQSNLDYVILANWIKSRRGQIIVCEKAGARWLPFKPLAEIAICGRLFSQEAVWLNL